MITSGMTITIIFQRTFMLFMNPNRYRCMNKRWVKRVILSRGAVDWRRQNGKNGMLPKHSGVWMRRNAYYAVICAALIVTASAVAVSVTRYLSARMYAPPRAGAVQDVARAERPASTLPPEQWINVFSPASGMKVPARTDNVKGTDSPSAAAPGTVYALVGTIVASDPESARAILWADGMREPHMYRLRQEVEPGVTLVKIEREAAWLQRGKSREKLDLLPVGSKVRIAAAPAAPGAAMGTAPSPTAGQAAGGTDLRVTRIGENTFSMDEAGLNQLTSNFNQFMTQVRMIPYFEGNKNSGYRLAAIRPGTAFEKLGFAGGDVIQAINGIDLTSPERMFTIFQNLKDEKRVAVNVLRQGKKTTLTYEIR
jgi:type II secretion system protein C